MHRLDPGSALLLVVDVQERLATAMPQAAMDRLVSNTLVLLESARLLGIPVVATEQYPKGLGPTVAPLAEKLRAMGVEPIVCVFQRVRELARRGIDVHVVADAVVSRREENRALGLGLCERAGALVSPTETVVFDWLGRAGSEAFKAISKLVR